MLRITFETTPGNSLARVHDVLDSTSTTVDSLLQIDRTEWLAFLTASDVAADPVDRIADAADISLVYNRSYTTTSETALLLVRFDGDPCIVRLVGEEGAIPHAVRVHATGLTGTVTVEDWEHLQAVADAIEAQRESFELVSVNQVEHVDAILGSDRLKQTVTEALSTEQLRTLEAAYRSGYFHVPQRASASDVAEELGISQSTFSKRIRQSAASLLELLFGEGPAPRAEDTHSR